MKIVLFGGSGFLGKHLLPKLLAQGHIATLISRRPEMVRKELAAPVEVKEWSTSDRLASILDGTDAVVNLAGESIGARRWTARRKNEILSSRIETTKTIADALGKISRKPSVLINASAVGYYGNVESDEVNEIHPAGDDFLADVCIRWEQEARKAEQLGIRVVLPRSGVVLAKDGGALQRMLLPFRFYVGGPLGSGNQWFPWIHIDDEIGAMVHLLEHSSVSGPVNLVAPEPVTMKQFCSALGSALHRPSWAPVPSFVLRIALGEMAEALVLGGQKAVSQKIQQSGYEFKFSLIEKALENILR